VDADNFGIFLGKSETKDQAEQAIRRTQLPGNS
jgi:hypothetical protein